MLLPSFGRVARGVGGTASYVSPHAKSGGQIHREYLPSADQLPRRYSCHHLSRVPAASPPHHRNSSGLVWSGLAAAVSLLCRRQCPEAGGVLGWASWLSSLAVVHSVGLSTAISETRSYRGEERGRDEESSRGLGKTTREKRICPLSNLSSTSPDRKTERQKTTDRRQTAAADDIPEVRCTSNYSPSSGSLEFWPGPGLGALGVRIGAIRPEEEGGQVAKYPAAGDTGRDTFTR